MILIWLIKSIQSHHVSSHRSLKLNSQILSLSPIRIYQIPLRRRRFLNQIFTLLLINLQHTIDILRVIQLLIHLSLITQSFRQFLILLFLSSNLTLLRLVHQSIKFMVQFCKLRRITLRWDLNIKLYGKLQIHSWD